MAGIFGPTLSLLLALVLVASPVPTSEAAATTHARPRSILALVDADWAFSPNGDGRQDSTHLSFTLRRSASVVLKVSGPPGQRWKVAMGALGAGRHLWTWDGRNPGGEIVRSSTGTTCQRTDVIAPAR